jgi:hypothetical protein
MYTVDLFKGRNLPRRSRPRLVASVAVPILVSVVIGIVACGPYVDGLIEIPDLERRTAATDAKIAALGDVRQFVETAESQKAHLRRSLADVANFMGMYVSWSPVLVALAQSAPPGLVVTKVEVKRESVAANQGVPTLPSFVLRCGMYVSPGERGATKVQQFMTNLRLPTPPGFKASDLRVVLQQREAIDEKECVFYLLECVLRQEGGR